MTIKNGLRQNQHDRAIIWTPERVQIKETILSYFKWGKTISYQVRGKGAKMFFPKHRVVLEQLVLDGILKVEEYYPSQRKVFFTIIKPL